MRGDVAAPLIYTATALDYLSIDRDKYDVVAALGNSMGWYSALALGGAVSIEDGFRISNAMGLNSQTHGPGGQILLQIVDEDWRPVPGLRETRSEEHTSELQSLMRISYAVFCLKKKNRRKTTQQEN